MFDQHGPEHRHTDRPMGTGARFLRFNLFVESFGDGWSVTVVGDVVSFRRRDGGSPPSFGLESLSTDVVDMIAVTPLSNASYPPLDASAHVEALEHRGPSMPC